MKKLITVVALSLLCLLLLTACGCEHQWLDATCSTPKKCAKCGAEIHGTTEEYLNNHQWEDATCTSARKCVLCGATEGKALDHTPSEWTTDKPATCTETGLASTTCLICGEAYTKELETAEHSEGDWIVLNEATILTKGKRAKKCTSCDLLLLEEEYEIPEEEKEEAYKQECETYEYETIARAPAEYNGKLAKFTGEVIQVQQSTILGYTTYVMRVNVTKQGYYSTYFTDTVYVSYTASSSAPKILEDDIITMYGQLQGEKTYETIFGASVTIPKFKAEYIDIL